MKQVNVFAVVLACVAGSGVASVTYSDGTFAAGTWGLEITQSNGGGGATAAQSAATGNPGAAFRVTTSVNPGSVPAASTVQAFHRYGTNTATRYDPASQGPIDSVAFSIDFRLISGFGDGHGLAVALKQGQTVYVAAATTTGSTGQWGMLAVSALTSDDFTPLAGGVAHPDFTAAGAPIRFGFVTSNSSVASAYSITVDYDNFRVVVSPPCPADFNRDGGVDGADVDAFFTTWEIGAAAADVNGDGGIDGGDVEAFFAVWELGGCA